MEFKAVVDWLQQNGYRVIVEDSRLKALCRLGGASKMTAEGFCSLLKPVSSDILVERHNQTACTTMAKEV